MTEPDQTSARFWRQGLRWAGRVAWANKAALLLMLFIGLSLVFTYLTLIGHGLFAADATSILWLLVVNLLLFSLLALVFLYRLVEVWLRRRRGMAGSHLHMRLVVVFSLLATVPSLLVAIFAAVFFYFGVQDWFSDKVRTAVEESLNVAEAYLIEHQQTSRAEARAMASDLNRESAYLLGSRRRLDQAVQTQALLRNLTEAVIFDGSGQVLAKSGLTFAMEFETVPEDVLSKARGGEVPVLTSDTDDRVRALVRLDQFVDAYLYVGRFIEPSVLAHMQAARDATQGYMALESRHGNLVAVMTLIFLTAALLLLLVAIGLALKFSSWIAMPITQLIMASDRVSGGDFSVRVAEPQNMDELSTLSRTFNRMTEQLEGQRRELIEANRQMDQRRRFTETVLGGVSAGVISLDVEGQVRLVNRRAVETLDLNEASVIQQPIGELIAGISPMLERVSGRRRRKQEEQLDVLRADGSTATLLVRVEAEQQDGEVSGFIVTFDDITDLVSAQRKAAWADVARRIAHEIKNPLTPIQLAAERLRRRYGALVPDDDQTFNNCVDTIIRQVGDIGGMVDEFSSFARMPTPVMRMADLVETVREVVFLQQQAWPKIRIQITESPERLAVVIDRRQIAQALTNILKNAVESVKEQLARVADSAGSDDQISEISVEIKQDDRSCSIAVRDSGIGFPDQERERLTEPYVTRRETGTGLGLAIVKKIMEDHGGSIRLEDNHPRGAYVTLVLSNSLTDTAGPEVRLGQEI